MSSLFEHILVNLKIIGKLAEQNYGTCKLSFVNGQACIHRVGWTSAFTRTLFGDSGDKTVEFISTTMRRCDETVDLCLQSRYREEEGFHAEEEREEELGHENCKNADSGEKRDTNAKYPPSSKHLVAARRQHEQLYEHQNSKNNGSGATCSSSGSGSGAKQWAKLDNWLRLVKSELAKTLKGIRALQVTYKDKCEIDSRLDAQREKVEELLQKLRDF